ncbi:hypothetical protein AH865_07900 [Salmonella enterica subsp. enterica serovar Infantis]|nr:hypothetical protein [Salmonella enterica subsp. enterica serovar Infantis]EGI5077976.1 hypothetical protein [Salmonella enterica subsp. enterica serovar Infantis]
MSVKKLPYGKAPEEMAHDIAMALIGNGWLKNSLAVDDENKARDIVKDVMVFEEHLTSAVKSYIAK